MEFLRLFTAVRPPEGTLDLIEKRQRALRQAIGSDAVRWVQRANMHITLHFLGDTPAARLGDLREALSAGVARSVRRQRAKEGADTGWSVPLWIGDIGAFPGAKRPRVIWIGVRDESGALATLQRMLREELSQRGFQSDPRPFRPHLTLGYTRKRTEPEAVRNLTQALVAAAEPAPRLEARPGTDTRSPDAASSGVRFSATQIVLVRSVLSPSGAVYEEIQSVSIAPASSSTSAGDSARE